MHWDLRGHVHLACDAQGYDAVRRSWSACAPVCSRFELGEVPPSRRKLKPVCLEGLQLSGMMLCDKE